MSGGESGGRSIWLFWTCWDLGALDWMRGWVVGERGQEGGKFRH